MSVNNATIHTQLPPNSAGQTTKVSNPTKKAVHRAYSQIASPSTIKDSSTIKIPLNSKSVPILSGVPSSQNVGFLTATNLYPNVKNNPGKNLTRTGFSRLNTANTIEIVPKSQGGNTQTIILSTAGKVRTQQQATAKIQSGAKSTNPLLSIVSRSNPPIKNIHQSNIQNSVVVPEMTKFSNVTRQEKTTKTIIASNIDQNFSGKVFTNPSAVNNNYNISSNKNPSNIASPSARPANQTNPVAFGSRKPPNNQTAPLAKQYKVYMPGMAQNNRPSQIVKPQSVVNMKNDSNKTLPNSNTHLQASFTSSTTSPSTGRNVQTEVRLIPNSLLPQANNTQQSPKNNVLPNILRRQQTRHAPHNDTLLSTSNKSFGPRKDMSRPQIIQNQGGAKLSTNGMMPNHSTYSLTQIPFPTKNDQQKFNNNILRVGSASASLHNNNNHFNGLYTYTQGGNSPHLKNNQNNATRVNNLNQITVQQRNTSQNKQQPATKIYPGNAAAAVGTFNHVVVSQPVQRPIATGTVVATSGVKRDFQTMQGDAQASSAITSRCAGGKAVGKVERSPRKKPRKQTHKVARDAGYSDEFVVVDSREEVQPSYRSKSGEKPSQPQLSNFNPIAQAQVGAISMSNKPNINQQQATYRNIQPKSDLSKEKTSVAKQQGNKIDSFDVQMKLMDQKHAATVQPLQQQGRPPRKNSGEVPNISQRLQPTVSSSNHRYSSSLEEAVRPLRWDDTYVYHRHKRRHDILNGFKLERHINNHFNRHSEVKIKPAKKPSLTDKDFDKRSFNDSIRNIGAFSLHLNSMMLDERSQQQDLEMVSKELLRMSDQVMNQETKMDPWEVLVSNAHLSKLGLSDKADLNDLEGIPLSVSANSVTHKFGFVAKKPFVVPGAVATAIHTVPSVNFTCLNNYQPEVDMDKLTVAEKNRFKMRKNFQKVVESVQINATKNRVSVEKLSSAFAKMQSTVALRDLAVKIVTEARRVDGEKAPLNGSNRHSSTGTKSGKKRRAYH